MHTGRPHSDAQPLHICALSARHTHTHTFTTNGKHNTDVALQTYGDYNVTHCCSAVSALDGLINISILIWVLLLLNLKLKGNC